MTPAERRVLASIAATRERHFTRKANGGSRHLETCMRGTWLNDRERYIDSGDGAGWGAPGTANCLADRAAFDAADALLAESAPVPITQLSFAVEAGGDARRAVG